MYDKIVNPKTMRKVNINTILGKKILSKYINILEGGKIKEPIWNEVIENFKTQAPSNPNKNVIIIGGGPVGLYTAILYKNDGYNVLVVEQSSDFDREWIFFLQNSPAYSNIQTLPLEVRELLDESGCFVGAAPSVRMGKCFTKLNPQLKNIGDDLSDNEFLCDEEYGYNYTMEDGNKGRTFPVPVSVSIQHKNLVNGLLDIFLKNGNGKTHFINNTKLNINLRNQDIELNYINSDSGPRGAATSTNTIESEHYKILIGSAGARDPVKTEIIKPNDIQVFNDLSKPYRIEERIKPEGNKDHYDKESGCGFIIFLGKKDAKKWKKYLETKSIQKIQREDKTLNPTKVLDEAWNDWKHGMPLSCGVKNTFVSDKCQMNVPKVEQKWIDDIFHSDSFLRYANYPIPLGGTADVNYYFDSDWQGETSFPQHKYRFFIPRTSNLDKNRDANDRHENSSNYEAPTYYISSIVDPKVFEQCTKEGGLPLKGGTKSWKNISDLLGTTDKSEWSQKYLYITIISMLCFYNIIEIQDLVDNPGTLNNIMDEVNKILDMSEFTMFKVHLRYSETTTKFDKNKLYYNVGDSALGGHYFTGTVLNAGIKMAENSVKTSNDIIKNIKDKAKIKESVRFNNFTNLKLCRTNIYNSFQSILIFNKGLINNYNYSNWKTILQIGDPMTWNGSNIDALNEATTKDIFTAGGNYPFKQYFSVAPPEGYHDKLDPAAFLGYSPEEIEALSGDELQDYNDEVDVFVRSELYLKWEANREEILKKGNNLGVLISHKYGLLGKMLYNYYRTKADTDNEDKNKNFDLARYVLSEIFYSHPLARDPNGSINSKDQLLTYSRQFSDAINPVENGSKNHYESWEDKYQDCNEYTGPPKDKPFYCDKAPEGKFKYGKLYRDRLGKENQDINFWEILNRHKAIQNVEKECQNNDDEEECNEINSCRYYTDPTKGPGCYPISENCDIKKTNLSRKASKLAIRTGYRKDRKMTVRKKIDKRPVDVEFVYNDYCNNYSFQDCPVGEKIEGKVINPIDKEGEILQYKCIKKKTRQQDGYKKRFTCSALHQERDVED